MEPVHILLILSGLLLGALVGYVMGTMLSVKKEVHMMYLNAEHFDECPYLNKLRKMAAEEE